MSKVLWFLILITIIGLSGCVKREKSKLPAEPVKLAVRQEKPLVVAPKVEDLGEPGVLADDEKDYAPEITVYSQRKLGGKLVHVFDDMNSTSVYLIDLAAQKSKRVITLPRYYGDYDLTSSPDGQLLSITVTNRDGVHRTWIIDLSGQIVRKIDGWCLDWSHDGKKFVGLTLEGDKTKTFIANADGSDYRLVRTVATSDLGLFLEPNPMPKWSLDDQQIVCGGDLDMGELWKADKNGENVKTFYTKSEAHGSDVKWLSNNRIMTKIGGAFRCTDTLLIIDTKTGRSEKYGEIEGNFSFFEGDYCSKTDQIVASTDWGYYDTTLAKVFLIKLAGLKINSITSLTETFDGDVEGDLESSVFSPAGGQVAFVLRKGGKSKITIIDTKTKKTVAEIKNLPIVSQLHWLP